MVGLCCMFRRLSSLCAYKQLNIAKESILKRRNLPKNQFQIAFSPTRYYANTYEGDGKTVGFVINKKTADVLCVNSITSHGFVMVNGDEFVGSVVVFPHMLLSWHITKADDITEESLTLFKIVEPKLDIIVFGYGAKEEYSPKVREKFSAICRKLGIKFEVLPTEQACGIFNFLAAERRYAVGIFIPPSEVDPLKLDRSKNLLLEYESDDETDEELPSLEAGGKKPLALPSSSEKKLK